MSVVISDGRAFPDDYTPTYSSDKRGRITYALGKDDVPQSLIEHPKTRRFVIPYEDHPVVCAYYELTRSMDMGKPADRQKYLEFISLAMPMDDWDCVTSRAPKITAAIQEMNRMTDLELMLNRLDAAERRQDRLERELSDDARSQGDATMRHGAGSMTVEVQE